MTVYSNQRRCDGTEIIVVNPVSIIIRGSFSADPPSNKPNHYVLPVTDPDQDNGGRGGFSTGTHDIGIFIDKIKNINFDIGY
jgi:hypothetical protein